MKFTQGLLLASLAVLGSCGVADRPQPVDVVADSNCALMSDADYDRWGVELFPFCNLDDTFLVCQGGHAWGELSTCEGGCKLLPSEDPRKWGDPYCKKPRRYNGD